jgi:hypothetical protein
VKRRRRGWSPDNHAYQHRSPDPTKIERATATSTAALFFLLANAASGLELRSLLKTNCADAKVLAYR